MFLNQSKPTSNSRRWVKQYTRHLNISYQYWTLLAARARGNGRNIQGIITTRHRRGAKNNVIKNLTNKVFYSSWVALCSTSVVYKSRIPIMYLIDRFKNIYLMRLVAGLEYGDKLQMFPLLPEWEVWDCSGTRSTLHRLLPGMICCDIFSFYNNRRLATSAGTYCSFLTYDFETSLTKLLLPSGQEYVIRGDSICTVGRIAHEKQRSAVLGKAGATHLLGWRPTVRGVAMNPIDHPHGGRTKTNSPEKSPWGWVTKFNK